LAVRLFPFTVALLETAFFAAGAFTAAAFLAGSGSATVTAAAGVAPVATSLRAGDFLAGASLATVLVTVAFLEPDFPALARRLEPFGSLGLPDSVAVLVASGTARAGLGVRAFRPDAAFWAGRFDLAVEPLPFDSKASVTTASASSNVS
jgi:hypothetical protein